MKAWRILLAVVGVGVGLFGVFRLVTEVPVRSLVFVLIWLAAAVIIHDGVLSPLVVSVGWLLRRVVPDRARRHLQFAMIICGMITVVAAPMIYLRGSQPAVKAILLRNYGANLTMIIALVAVDHPGGLCRAGGAGSHAHRPSGPGQRALRADLRSAGSGPAVRGRRRVDLMALAGAVILIGATAIVGHELNRRGHQILLPAPPLLASWQPHVGWGTPLAVACLVLGLRLQQHADHLPWRRLLLAGWLLDLSWMISLALVDGLRRGWIEVLLNPNEYLHDLPRINDPRQFLATFTDFIAFAPTVGGDAVWTTHVSAHPPAATLVFWGLDRVGLGGGFWAGALCILVSSAAAVAVPVTLRALGAPAAARRAVPFAALFPGAVWMAVSADGLFAGVASAGLALVCLGAARARLLLSLLGGLLLGMAVYLSYGLVLFGIVVVVAMIITVGRRGGRRSIGPWLMAGAGLIMIIAVHSALGFNWLTGLSALRIRYQQGVASERPFSYFVFANVAAWLISCSPLLAVGLARAVRAVSRRRPAGLAEDRVVAWVALAGLLAALVADASALSKAETERIWLGFGVVAFCSLALLRGRTAAWALLGCGISALAVNHLFDTGW